MSRERSLPLLFTALLLVNATLGCNSSGSQQRPPATGPERVAALHGAGDPGVIDLSFSLSGPEEEDTDLTFGAEGKTVVDVDEDTVSDAAGILHFTAARRGQETIGVRVFFEAGQEDGDDETYLGLRRADRIEEVDGLTIGSLSRFLEAWQGVGMRPEVRLLVNRAGRSHAVIYRRRSLGTALGY